MRSGVEALREGGERQHPSPQGARNVHGPPQAHGSQDPSGHEQRTQQEPADEERNSDADESRSKEFGCPAALHGVPREEAREQKEEFHAERMTHRGESRDPRAGGDILHRPTHEDRDEGQTGVEDHSQQECKRPGGIEKIEAPGRGRRDRWAIDG